VPVVGIQILDALLRSAQAGAANAVTGRIAKEAETLLKNRHR
jgi:hypothetical protein